MHHADAPTGNLAGQSEARLWTRFTASLGADAWRHDATQNDDLSHNKKSSIRKYFLIPNYGSVHNQFKWEVEFSNHQQASAE